MIKESCYPEEWFQEWTADDRRQQEERRRQRWSELVHINPQVRVLNDLCLKATYGDLRGMLHDGDLYWWDSAYATHHDAQHWMGIAGSKLDIGVELHTQDDGSVGLCAFEAAVLDAVMAHPSLIGCVSADYVLIPDPTLRLPF